MGRVVSGSEQSLISEISDSLSNPVRLPSLGSIDEGDIHRGQLKYIL